MSILKIMLNPSNQYDNVGNDGIVEAERSRDFAERIKSKIIGDTGFDVKITEKDVTDNLQAVVQQENAYKPHVFLSLHSNAGPINNASGVECYYYQGTEFTRKISERLVNATNEILNIPKRGVFTSSQAPDGGLYVVDRTTAPAMLIETFFHTSDADIDAYKRNIDKLANEFAYILKDACIAEYGRPETPGVKYLYDKGYTSQILVPDTVITAEMLGLMFKRHDGVK